MESFEPKVCARYLEYLIEERGEESAYFHDRLAELYLKMTLTAKRKGDDGEADTGRPAGRKLMFAFQPAGRMHIKSC